MKAETRRHAAVLLTVLPTVVYGGVSLLSLLTGGPDYAANPLRQDLWRAGHAHAGVLWPNTRSSACGGNGWRPR